MAEEGKKYVLHGMYAECSMGTMKNYLNTDVGHGVIYQGQPLLNANDHTPQINLTHFGDCNSKMIFEEAKKQADEKYKAESGDNFFERAGKAIAKTVTKAAVTLQECFASNKCQLDTPLPWRFCNEEHMIDGAPALTVGSVCPCKFGGIISIIETPEPEGEAEIGSESVEQATAAVSKKTVSVSMAPVFAGMEVPVEILKEDSNKKEISQKALKEGVQAALELGSKIIEKSDLVKANLDSDVFDFPTEYIEFLKSYEEHKIENGRYVLDNNGKTIALGHDVLPGEDFSQGLSIKEGELLAIQDLNKKYIRVKQKIDELNELKYNIDKNGFTRREMLFFIDFEYNRGDGLVKRQIDEEKQKNNPEPYGNLKTSIAILIAAVANKDYKKVDEVLMEEVKNRHGKYLPGLEKRRMDEYELLLFGDYKKDDDITRDYKTKKK